MFATYEEALQWIHGQSTFGMKPGLKRMEWMMDYLGNPHQKIKTIHVGGTNGKGSTVTYLRSMLVENGYTVGTFTSPYIEIFNERISLNGKPISNEEMLRLANAIYPAVQAISQTELDQPTEFEIITAMCFYYFGELHPVDFVIMEVGLGGRLDSTNIITPLASIITNIGLDHVNILGSTYKEIAYEKAGIIKENSPLFTCAKQKEVLAVFEEKCKEQNSSFYTLGKDFYIQSAANDFEVITPFGTLKNIKLSMVGEHQKENASLAISTLLYLKESNIITISEEKLLSGLKKAFWPGRFEKIHNEPVVILDGAHNLEGVEALVQTVKKEYKEQSISIYFTALKDKDCAQMIQALDEIATKITFVSFDFYRASNEADLAVLSNHPNKHTTTNAYENIVQEINEPMHDVILITGSLYFISEIRNQLIN